jgi:hypothetical protein
MVTSLKSLRLEEVEGKDVIISATNNYTCPVAMLSRYLLLANISEGSNDYIFRPISYCSKSKTYRLRKSGICR